MVRMSFVSQILGGTRKTTSIVGKYSSAGFTPDTIDGEPYVIAALSGALTANTLKTMLNITSVGGRMPKLAFKTADATARTMRVVVTVDGVSVYDFTSASFSASNTGIYLAGKGRGEVASTFTYASDIVFTTSLKIEIASNLTETNKFTMYYLYNTES